MQKGFDVKKVDLSEEELSTEEILKLVTKDGRMRGPIITQDDKVIVFGYNREKLESLFS